MLAAQIVRQKYQSTNACIFDYPLLLTPHTQTYHNGHIDLPTDEDLRNVATKVSQSLQGDWTTLQATLDIPDYIMLDVLSQRSIELQVYRWVGVT